MLAILIGKSGSGKDTLRDYLVKELGYEPLVSVTTRKPRPNEQDGVDYYFTDNKTFEAMLDSKEIFEHREYNGAEGKVYYGAKKNDLDPEKNYVKVLDPNGARTYTEVYGLENCFVAQVTVPDEVRYERACLREGLDPTDEQNVRLQEFRKEWDTRLASDNKLFKPNDMGRIANVTIDNSGEDIESAAAVFSECLIQYKEEMVMDKRVGMSPVHYKVTVNDSDALVERFKDRQNKENHSNPELE